MVAELDTDELIMADAYYSAGIQLARFKPIFQTWRGRTLSVKECVSKGQVLAYLDGGTTRRGKEVKRVKQWVNEDDLNSVSQQTLL